MLFGAEQVEMNFTFSTTHTRVALYSKVSLFKIRIQGVGLRGPVITSSSTTLKRLAMFMEYAGLTTWTLFKPLGGHLLDKLVCEVFLSVDQIDVASDRLTNFAGIFFDVSAAVAGKCHYLRQFQDAGDEGTPLRPLSCWDPFSNQTTIHP